MSNQDKKKNNQFKENKNHGEKRTGRLSQFKNDSAHGDTLDEYTTAQREE
ncbi:MULTISPECIES: hypothetical protein [Shouchella]|uniref:Uncharacterized protein n=2 Tax=Shouchella TaxID=2893057 RepID=A0ABY7W2A0_9BACI|nr:MULTISPECIES: hypothetical protein [Shouchella]MED4127921.1 hypothetical protein [Shouchella miscanthi]WDF03067.1 hypothetical protein PQ477_16450 [Shouchella hunanensis]